MDINASPWAPAALSDIFVIFNSLIFEVWSSSSKPIAPPWEMAVCYMESFKKQTKPCKPSLLKTLASEKCWRWEIVMRLRSWKSFWKYAKTNQYRFVNVGWQTLTELQIKPIFGGLLISCIFFVIVTIMHWSLWLIPALLPPHPEQVGLFLALKSDLVINNSGTECRWKAFWCQDQHLLGSKGSRERAASVNPSCPAIRLGTELGSQQMRAPSCSSPLNFGREKLFWYKQTISNLWVCDIWARGMQICWLLTERGDLWHSEGNSQVESI